SAGFVNPSSGYTFVPGVIFFASYNDCTAASRNILLQLASRNRSDGCVTRYPGSAHVYARENFVTPFFATASCAARTPLACMNDCIAWSRAASVGTAVPGQLCLCVENRLVARAGVRRMRMPLHKMRVGVPHARIAPIARGSVNGGRAENHLLIAGRLDEMLKRVGVRFCAGCHAVAREP